MIFHHSGDSNLWCKQQCRNVTGTPKLNLLGTSAKESRESIWKGFGKFKINLEGVWTNLLSITFKSTNQFCYCQLNRVSTALGFLLVLGATLDVRHHSVLTRETPQRLTNLLPTPDESKAYIFPTKESLECCSLSMSKMPSSSSKTTTLYQQEGL